MKLQNNSLRTRLLRRSKLLAEASILCLASSTAFAAVVTSPVSNLPVPQTFDGVYINIVTGATGTTGGTTAGWDFNPFLSGTVMNIFWSPAPAGGVVAPATTTPLLNLAPGTVISGASTFTRTTAATNPNYHVTGTEILGLQFLNEATGVQNFGYAVIQTTAPGGFPATVVSITYENTGAPITVGGGNTPPQFAYAPAAGGTVNFTGGGAVGSTGTGTVTVTVGTAGSGTGTAATTTTTCTAPAAPFAGFGQTVTAVGNGAISGSPLSGTCTLGAAAATATLTCSENRGGTAVPVTFQLSGPAGTVAPVTSTPPSGTAIAFGNAPVGSPATRQVTFNNSAGTAQTVTCTAPAAPFSAAPLSIPVPAGGSAATTITFSPTAVGTFSGTLNCTAGATAFTFPLTGTGVAPAVATSVPTLGDTGRWLAILMLLGIGLAAMVVRKH